MDIQLKCNQCLYHHLSCEFEPRSWRGVLDTTLCDKVSRWLATGQWFSPGTPVSSTNKTDRHDITEILLNVALNTINHKLLIEKNTCQSYNVCIWFYWPNWPLDKTCPFPTLINDSSIVCLNLHINDEKQLKVNINFMRSMFTLFLHKLYINYILRLTPSGIATLGQFWLSCIIWPLIILCPNILFWHEQLTFRPWSVWKCQISGYCQQKACEITINSYYMFITCQNCNIYWILTV